MVTVKEAAKALSKLPKKARNKMFCGLTDHRMIGGAWQLQNKACYKEWQKYCNVSRPEDIDYNEPHVKIECMLNNPLYRKRLSYGTREEIETLIYSQLTTDEEMDLYFVGDGTGAYCELEKDGGVKAKQWYKKHKENETS